MKPARLASLLAYAFRTLVLRRPAPYLFALVLTDRCNLDCFYCESKNSGRLHCTFDQARGLLEGAARRGHRSLAVTGGEPMLWRDSGRGLADLVRCARGLGFHDVFISTNGTFPLDIPDCGYLVTVDGTQELHERVRGGTYGLIMENVRRAACRRVFATITLSRHNAHCLERYVREITACGLFRGISFNLLTHRPQVLAEHGLSPAQREALLDRLWALKGEGYPISLSRAAYLALRRNDWKRPITQIELGTKDRVFTCCRDVGTAVCDSCGYSGCVEVSQMVAWKPSAIRQVLGMVA